MSERFPPARREDHDAFCVTESWDLVRGATGQPVKHHRTYELTLWDRRILRTRISRPVDRTEYRASMWSHILRTQLEVDAPAFWDCVRDQVTPDRGRPASIDMTKAVPLYLVRALRELGVSEDEILDLGAARAAALYAERLAQSQAGDA